MPFWRDGECPFGEGVATDVGHINRVADTFVEGVDIAVSCVGCDIRHSTEPVGDLREVGDGIESDMFDVLKFVDVVGGDKKSVVAFVIGGEDGR